MFQKVPVTRLGPQLTPKSSEQLTKTDIKEQLSADTKDPNSKDFFASLLQKVLT